MLGAQGVLSLAGVHSFMLKMYRKQLQEPRFGELRGAQTQVIKGPGQVCRGIAVGATEEA